MAQSFEPRIVAILCNWCAYAGADLAGVSRFQYPPNVRVLRVMCSGTVSPHHVLHAFQRGADGVLVAGCHIGDCHYLKGNYMTIKRMKFVQELIRFAGYNPERFRLEWISSAEGVKFAEVIRDFIEKVRALGPAPSFEASPRLALGF